LVKRFDLNDARLPARFRSKVSVNQRTGCWTWIGTLMKGNYGQFRYGGEGSKYSVAHKFSYEALVGAVANGLQLDHLCRVRRCVNPAHLEAVTPRENTMRGNTAAARNARKTHCIRGHAFNAANTRIDALGKRCCRKCACLYQARSKAKHAEVA